MPPSITESMTSNDMVVREGTNVTLVCRASGYPEPYVMWRREDGGKMFVGGENGTYCFIYYFHCKTFSTYPGYYCIVSRCTLWHLLRLFRFNTNCWCCFTVHWPVIFNLVAGSLTAAALVLVQYYPKWIFVGRI